MNTRLTVLLAALALPLLAEVELPQATTSLIAPALDGITGMGTSQAMNDSYIVLGAPDFDHPSTQNAGAAYVFSATTRKLIRRLTSPVLVLNERFGQTVAIFGNIAYIGAGGNDTLAANGGAVYAFDIPTGRKLWSNQGAQANAEMGAAALVATQDHVLVGIPKGNAPGKPVNSGLVRWITRRTGITETFSSNPSAAMNDAYGAALASSGSTIAIGSPFADVGSVDRGCVYLLTNPENLVATLSLTGGIGFGSTVALHGRTLIASSGSSSNYFAIFDLLRNNALRFVDAPLDSGTPFGQSLAIKDDLAFVNDPNHASGGRVLVYDVSSTGIPTPQTLPAPPGLPGGADFGNQVLAHQGRLLVGTGINRSTTFDYQNIRRTLSQQFTEIVSTATVSPGISAGSISTIASTAINYTGVTSFIGTFRTAGSSASQSASWGTTSGLFDLMTRAGDAVATSKISTHSSVIQNGLKRALILTRLTPGNKLAVLQDDGTSITTLLHEGGTASGGQTISRLHSIVQPQQTTASPIFNDLLAASASFQTGVAGVNAAKDSAIVIFSGSATPFALEGSTEPVTGAPYGQFAPRVARWKNDIVFASALQGVPSTTNTVIIRRNLSGTSTVIARKGDPATGVTNGKFSTFLGECVNTAGSVLFRATLTGVPASENEGLWLYSNGTLKLMAQKNTSSLGGMVWNYRRLLKFFLLDNNEAIVHIQNSSSQTTSANDDLVLAIESDGNGWRRVFEEGNPADSCGEARFGPLQRLDVDTSGHLILTAPLLNSPTARNAALFSARASFSGLASQSIARLLVRKGDAIDRIGSETITAVTISPTLPPTGAGSTGAAKVTAAGRSLFTLQFADKTQTVMTMTP